MDKFNSYQTDTFIIGSNSLRFFIKRFTVYESILPQPFLFSYGLDSSQDEHLPIQSTECWLKGLER